MVYCPNKDRLWGMEKIAILRPELQLQATVIAMTSILKNTDNSAFILNFSIPKLAFVFFPIFYWICYISRIR